jgi:uncharacterized protein with predicted RNA binding PUA domain
MDRAERETLRTIADYQFGAGAGRALFPVDEELTVVRTSSGRPQQVRRGRGSHENGDEDGDEDEEQRVVSYGIDGRFTLGIAGGKCLYDAIDRPTVEVGDESVPFVREEKNAFSKFVRDVDEDIRPGDEVIVTYDGTVLAVGCAEVSARAMCDFETGVAVSVRDGAGKQT